MTSLMLCAVPTSVKMPSIMGGGVDLEFDGSCELYITIRYSRYAYYSPDLDGCDPLLASLIRRRPLTKEEKSDTNENEV